MGVNQMTQALIFHRPQDYQLPYFVSMGLVKIVRKVKLKNTQGQSNIFRKSVHTQNVLIKLQ